MTDPMGKSELKTFLAEIDYLCVPMEAHIKEKSGKRIISGQSIKGEYSMEKMGWLERTMNPTKWKQDFWKDIRQWYFAFKDNDADRVKGYYRQYGLLLPYRPMNLNKNDYVEGDKWEDGDSWELNELTLGWFNLLTCMLDWLKQQKAGPLWDLFPKKMPMSPGVFIYPEGTPINDGLEKMTDYSYGIRCYSVHSNYPEDTGSYTLSNDSDLFELTWYFIVKEVDKVMNRLMLCPSPGFNDDFSFVWNFYASGAFEAAFLQWYFQELADYHASKCINADCENLVIPPLKKRGKKKIYCSDRCRWRANKQKQRMNV